MSRPFNRALVMLSAIAMALQSSAPQIELMKIGPYRSRGKGRGSRGTHNDQLRKRQSNRYMPHQGKQERARRVSQMARGLL